MRGEVEGSRLRTRRVGTLLVAAFLLVSLSSSGFAQADTARLDPSLRMDLEATLGLSASGLTIRALIEGRQDGSIVAPQSDERWPILVRLADDASGAALDGLTVIASAGRVTAVSASVADLLNLIADSDVVYIEPARRTSPSLDVSVPAVHGDTVHAGSPPLMGEGVIVGAVDTGIDYTHLDFRTDEDNDGFEESSRILAILDQSSGLFGIEYTQADIESDLAHGYDASEGIVRERDTDGHGTHVTGIAAGDGSSSASGFVGMAPEAWIVMVKTSYFTSDILAGIQYIFDVADSLDLPAVVNLSLGGHEGAHDGTSLFEQGIDQLANGPGRIVVVSAGNEGDEAIHASEHLLGNAASYGLDIDGWEAEIDLWYPGTSEFTITITPPSGTPVSASRGTDTGLVQTAYGNVRIDNASTGRNPNNGDCEAFIRLSGLLMSGDWEIEIVDAGGSGGTFDAWIISGTATFIGGDSSSTIDEPGNADNVITVGSFNTKATWPSLSGDQNYLAQFPIGVLSSFSSQGPTRDGRRKPELCAPGAWISSALSSDALWQGYLVQPDGVHTMSLGTSMAAPHVSGAVALMLSVDPGLTIGEVRSILTSTASRDGYTGAVPNDRWGWGKLDVAAALAEVDEPDPPPVDPNPSDSEIPAITLAVNPVADVAEFVLKMPDGVTWAELRIYSATGRLVYDVSVYPSDDGVDWPLITDDGASLASGLYLYVLATNLGPSEVGKLVIAR